MGVLFIALLFISLFCENSVQAQVKLGQTGFQFLSVVSDARAGGLGTAMTAVPGGANSLFFNVANMSRADFAFDVNASRNEWFADIYHTAFSVAFRPVNGRFGVIGISYVTVDYGELQGTMVWDNNKGYIDTDKFSPSAFVIGLGYAKQLSDRFAIGAQTKFASQYLGMNVIPSKTPTDESRVEKNTASGFAFDFGTVYRTEFRSLAIGMSLRNFSKEFSYVSSGFQLPMEFRIGLSMDVFQMVGVAFPFQKLLATFDAVHPRSYPEYVNLGFEYNIFESLDLRAGYISNRDFENITFGFGVNKYGIAFDYSYTPFGLLNAVQRFTIHISI